MLLSSCESVYVCGSNDKDLLLRVLVWTYLWTAFVSITNVHDAVMHLCHISLFYPSNCLGNELDHSSRRFEVTSEGIAKTVDLVTCKTIEFSWQTFPSMSGSLIYCFLFFFLLDIQYRRLLLRLPESQRGKVSMLPQCSLLAGQCHSRLNCFRLSTSAIRALPPPPSNSPSFYCPKIYNLCFAFAVFVLLSFTQTQ